MTKKLILLMAAVGLSLGLSACRTGSPVGCTGTVNGKCVSTGTKPPALF